jgi:hypothetical protein
MAVNVADYFTKMQQESLNTLKQGQDASIKALEQFRSFGKEFAEKPGTLPTFENMPSPTQLVEMSFGFAAQVLELRKAYTLKIAEMLVDTQKQVDATFKQATANVQNATQNATANMTSNGSPVAPKPVSANK